MKNIYKRFLSGWVIIVSLCLGEASSQADMEMVLPFETWVGKSPLQKITFNANLFEKSDFSDQISTFLSADEWKIILLSTDFASPVQAIGDWLVITGEPRPQFPSQLDTHTVFFQMVKPLDDMVIFIHIPTQQIGAICYSKEVPVISSSEFSPALQEKMLITYYTGNKKMITQYREMQHNCANGDAKVAVQRWREANPIKR